MVCLLLWVRFILARLFGSKVLLRLLKHPLHQLDDEPSLAPLYSKNLVDPFKEVVTRLK